MKNVKVLLFVAAILAAYVGGASAKTVGVLYGDGLLIENGTDHTEVASISASGTFLVKGFIGLNQMSTTEVVNNTPTVAGLMAWCANCAPARPIWSIIGGWVFGTGVAAP